MSYLDEEHTTNDMVREAIAVIALVALCSLIFIGCGDTIIAPDPVPTPAPTPNPCEVRRVDVVALIRGTPVVAWPLGEVPSVEARLRFSGDFTGMNTSTCPQLDVVTWTLVPGSQASCEFQGNLNSPSVRLQCYTPGVIVVKVVPQGYTILPGEASFKVQGG